MRVSSSAACWRTTTSPAPRAETWPRDSPPARSIALEIAVNDETERCLLHAEAAELERQWKEDEEIAAIADRELVFLPRSLDDEPT